MRGRPTKLTPEVIERIGVLRRRGKSDVYIAAEIGVAPQTLITWKHRGKAAKSGLFHEFHESYLVQRKRYAEDLHDVIYRSAMFGGVVERRVRRHVVRDPDGEIIGSKEDMHETVVGPNVLDAKWLLEREDRWKWGARPADASEGSDDAGPVAIQVRWVAPPKRNADGDIVNPDGSITCGVTGEPKADG